MIKKTIIFSILIIFILSFITFVSDRGLRKTGYYNYQEWNDIVNGRASSDIYIQGSSRAWVHVSPKILEKKLNMSVYNFGIDGHKFNIQNARYNLYKKYNKKPKIIIQILDFFSLEEKSDLYEAEQFYPYYNEEILINTIEKINGFNSFTYNIPFLKYSGKYQYNLIGFLEYFNIKHFTSNKYKGYKGQERTWSDDFNNFKKNNDNGIHVKIDNQMKNDFEEFLLECKKDNIKVFLIYAPEYFELNKYIYNKKAVINLYKTLADKYNFTFIDFSNDKLSFNKNLFYNSQHLNKEGSELFTNEIVKHIENKTKEK
ncbi:MAG: hypothetical protein ACK4IX_03135 [Candidatus Sericytochromatia bacterium]